VPFVQCRKLESNSVSSPVRSLLQATGLLVVCFLLAQLAFGSEGPASSEATRRAINLEALSRLEGIDLEANPGVKAVVLKLLDQLRGTPQFVEVVRKLNIRGQTQLLLEAAANDPSGATGVEAMRLVLQSGELSSLKVALEGTNAVKLAEALGNTGEKEIVPLLAPLVPDPAKSLPLRQQAVRALAKVKEGANDLLELARAQKLPEDLRLTAASELNNVRWDNIKQSAAQLLPLPKSLNSGPLPPISELIKLQGDRVRGAVISRRETVGCFKCHQINGEGTDFGPNLSEIGTKLAKSAIYESILDPSAGIAFGYEAWDLELKNGDDAVGLIVSETADELALKAVGGIVSRYKKADIARRTKQKLSIMPAGLEQTMSKDELVDLVEYLCSLKKAAAPAAATK
jgi:putative heme-binding domain-containing protein